MEISPVFKRFFKCLGVSFLVVWLFHLFLTGDWTFQNLETVDKGFIICVIACLTLGLGFVDYVCSDD